MTSDLNKLTVRRKKALYRAEHRGTKELDFLLGRFARERLSEMSEAELTDFERLMQLPEPLIESWIMKDVQVENREFLRVIKELRDFHGM